MAGAGNLRVGVLALQGAFREHATLLKKIPNVDAVEVRTCDELDSVAGLVIPGGESTTMALVAAKWGLIDKLKELVREGRPIYGTCAGLIFLADRAHGQKEGGQPLLGGLDVCVHRNFFGAQVESFEAQIPAPKCLQEFGSEPCRAIFIRAPAVLEAGPGVEVLCNLELNDAQKEASGRDSVAVAVGTKSIIATAFHPELTGDYRWHQLFVEKVRDHLSAKGSAKSHENEVEQPELGRTPNVPNDLPVFGQEHICA